MKTVLYDMNAIRRTLKSWKGPPKEPTWIKLDFKPFENYDDSPKHLGRPREPTKRLSKKDKKLRKHWRKASVRYYRKRRDEILLKAAMNKTSNRLVFYQRIKGIYGS